MITGVWHGKIDKQKVEVKMVRRGDSLNGTSYYYESANRYRRYSIKGYLDPKDNSIVWWDDQLLEDRNKLFSFFSKHRNPYSASKADFNCPGGGVMKLDGNVFEAEEDNPQGDVHLQKVESALFKDEWDYVIENYTVGANDPDVIDSISWVSQKPKNTEEPVEAIAPQKKVTENVKINEPVKKEIEIIPVQPKEEIKIQPSVKSPDIEDKFKKREKVFTKEITITADSIELRFYDNAVVDGDSISLFLNNKLIFEHIALTEKAFVIKLTTKDMDESNELIMVAENMGSIPPNTSYMVAIVGDKRYDAQLASAEGSSAMIRLVKNK